ncbi:hypothetical protein BP00DRAFT_259145 [Aspergillus indologenus CBS 114.80]|uniref:Uncharacterized protein n=1 Tax=Aspergillus indologenus CBS 114.80 TaxID=1450541 RepID=A0A2V5HVD0_9EURO|nr:hypothetical protein BP00DRAFT_259145 [Aspergillus indologenus CBS 114.80]
MSKSAPVLPSWVLHHSAGGDGGGLGIIVILVMMLPSALQSRPACLYKGELPRARILIHHLDKIEKQGSTSLHDSGPSSYHERRPRVSVKLESRRRWSNKLQLP